MIDIENNNGSDASQQQVPPLPEQPAPVQPVKRKRGRPPKVRPAVPPVTDDGSLELMGITQIPAKRPYHRRNQPAEERAPLEPKILKTAPSYLTTDRPAAATQDTVEQPLRQQTEQLAAGKKLHASDERFLRDAERMLFNEIGYALGLTSSEVLSIVLKKIHK